MLFNKFIKQKNINNSPIYLKIQYFFFNQIKLKMLISQNKKKEILKSTKQTLEGSSIHAIPNITRNNYYLIKIVWIVCFLVSFSWCCWFMVRSINDYLEFGVTSLIEVKYEHKLKFPVITICYLNLIKSNSLNDLIRKNFGYIPSFNLYGMVVVKTREFYYSNQLEKLNLNETIISCNYNNLPCNLTDDFDDQFYDQNYGQCFRFNSGINRLGQTVEQKYSYQNGILNGLILNLYIGSSDQNNNAFSISHGMNIFINDKNYLDSTYSEGINISPGTTTKILIDKISLKKEQQPYSECTANLNTIDSYKSDIYKVTFSSNRSYLYSDCKIVCMQKIFYEKCNCQIVNALIYSSSTRFCLNNLTTESISKDYTCLYEAFALFSASSQYIEKCDCPIECEKTFYTSVNSVAQYPTMAFADYLRNTSSLIQLKFENTTNYFEDIKKSVARVEIFFDELKQTTISEKIKTETSDLIANLGGTLGLFLGKIKY